MSNKEIIEFCLKNGLLLDKDILNLFGEKTDFESVKFIIEKIKRNTQAKIINKEVLNQNSDKVSKIFGELPENSQKILEELNIKLGLSIEISRKIGNPEPNFVSNSSEGSNKDLEVEIIGMPRGDFKNSFGGDRNRDKNTPFQNIFFERVFVNNVEFPKSKKIEVKDFVTYFRNRFVEVRNILQDHSEIHNLVSINKISNLKSNFCVIGIVSDKRTTKNGNLIFEIEDLTGKIKVLVSKDKKEVYEKAEDIPLDGILGFKVSGNNEILFVNDIIFPEAMIFERKKSPLEECALFIGDLHFGSKRFLSHGFNKFIDYLNGKMPNTPEVDKIKYLFIAGDLVTGVGNYPNQERDLVVGNLEEQFKLLAELFKKIRKDIVIIISPGNHDGVRLMEPQPFLTEKYAWPLYELENVFFTTNPATVNIGALNNKDGEKIFSGFNVLVYHGFSFPYYANNISKLMVEKTMNSPEKIMAYLLKQRHLAPTHASIQYFPFEKDPHLIREIPDIMVSSHTHKSAVAYYNNILTVSVSSWERKTPYQEKFGNIPDHCKVPMFNLKTRAIKILDFEDKEGDGE